MMAPNEAGTQEIRSRIAEMTNATATTPVATVIARLHAALATAPSRLLTATLEDAVAVEERPEHAGDHAPVAELVDRPADDDREAEGEPARARDRA